jgi:hypothetical protein
LSEEYKPERPCSMTIPGYGGSPLGTYKYPVSSVVPSALLNVTVSGTAAGLAILGVAA